MMCSVNCFWNILRTPPSLPAIISHGQTRRSIEAS